MTKKNSPHDPLAAKPFKKDLEALKKKLEDDEARRAAEEKARAEAAKARGEREAARRAAPAPAAKKSSSVDVWRPDMDKRLFEVAMSGVEPLSPKRGGRVPARAPEVAAREKKPRPEVTERQRRAEGGAEVPVAWTPEGTVRGAHRGREFALEALGRFSLPEETLDLHGLDPVAASLRVAEFVRTRRARGLRCVCVVTGYGKNSPDGSSVLLDAVVETLRAPPSSGELDAFASAPDDMGGRGALLVSLRH